MAVTIIANGHLGTLKKQRVSTNTTNVPLSTILNNANIIPPVTNEPNKVFSYWATTISGFDIGDYTISQLYSIGAITKDNILNIYANFTYVANSIQVTFNTNGGTFQDGSTSKVITTTMGSIYGELKSSISVLPTKSGSYFLKWTDPKNNTVNGSYEFTESVVITAQYSTSANTSITVKDSRSKPVISGSFPKLTLWRDLYAQAISNGYKPDDVKKAFSAIKPGYGSYTGQAIKSIDFSVANNPMKIGWLRGIINDYQSKKIRDFSATTVPVDPSTTFAVTGKATNSVALTHNPIGQDEYWDTRNLIPFSQTFNFAVGNNTATTSTKVDYDSTTKMIHITSPKGGSTNAGIYFSQLGTTTDTIVTTGDTWTFGLDIKGTGKYSRMGIEASNPFNKLSGEVPSDWTRVYTTGTAAGTKNAIIIYFDSSTEALDVYIKLPSLSKGTHIDSDWTPAMENIKPGLWLNNNWLYNPYTQKWLDTPIDNTDYSYANSVITFKDYFNVQYVTGDISKVRSSVTATVKSVVAGYGSTTDRKALYDNSYFPSDDSGVTLNVEEYLGYSYIVFYNPSTGYSQTVYQQVGTPYSEFLKGITKSKFEAAGKYLKGFYVSNYWTNSKLIASNPINSPIDMAKSDYLLQLISSFTTVFFNANGGVFYKGTSYETQQISVDVSKTDTYGIVVNYLPDISKRTMGLLYWVMDLDVMEPAYPLEVQNGKTLYAKWSVVDRVELYRKPREYYLIDLKSVYNGWDMMDKFSISDRNNIFVIDPTGTGSSYSETNSKSNSNGWSKYDRSMSTNAIEFDAYYQGYEQYNRLGRWIRGKELVLAMLNETGVPTYWTVELNEIERTEIKHGTDLLTGKLSFNKTSPAFDLEFIGLGTDDTIDNADDMFRRNAYVYIHSLQVPDVDNGIQIIATNGVTTIEDSVDVDLPAGSYFEYSTLPFREVWKYGPGWKDLPNNLYNNIIDLVGARPIRVGIGKWNISVSSSNKVTINSLAPHKIQDYAGKTIDSLGGLGPFTGIAIKEKEL